MKNNLKVLHIIKTLDLGGAEMNLFNLVTAFGKGKVEHHVAYSSGGELEARFIDSGIPLFKYADAQHNIKSPASLCIIARLMAYIIRNDIDIIHTHTFNGHVWGGLAAKLAGKKVIEHVHDGRYRDPIDASRRCGGFTQWRYVKYFCWLPDAVVVLTRQNAKYILDNLLHKKNKIFQIMNGIPPRHIEISVEAKHIIKQKFQLSPDSFVITSVSRMSPEKNIDLILRIAPFVKQHIPEAVFVVAGNGPLLDKYRISAQVSKADYVKFIGFCDKTGELLSVTDIFLLPSFLELHSIALLEAMSVGIPVITSKDVGSNCDFITHAHNGFLFDPFKDEGWGEAIIDLWKSLRLRVQVGQAAKRTCEQQFDITQTAIKFTELYEYIVNRK
jgi:glycosyltransferase involved in cell wall biosynthesis